ncbi:MAG: ankyrin repeat domain-containing protein [Lentisphaeraceae bacterium]|nr:ankyrin repeat domain-containing protein [Lentisphaeraceae bacterium]
METKDKKKYSKSSITKNIVVEKYERAPYVDTPKIPVNAPTGAKFRNELYSFLKLHILDHYEETVSSDSQKARYVDEVLKAIVKMRKAQAPEVLIREGKKLHHDHPEDIYISLAYSTSCTLNLKFDITEKVLASNYHSVVKSKLCGHIFKYLYFSSLYKARCQEAIPRNNEWKYSWTAMHDLLESGILDPKQERITYYLMTHYVNSWDYYKRLLKHHGFGPWIINMINGNLEKKKAWKIRGGGWVHEVSNKGWTGFKKHMNKAKSQFTKAWQIHKDWPEASTAMISMTMASHGNIGDTVYLWFNRAIEAEVDYSKAYEDLIWALRPRWGGSVDQILELGQYALSSERFDTHIPLAYLHGIFSLAADYPGYSWRTTFRDPQRIKLLDYLVDNLEKNAPSLFEKERFKAMRGMLQLFRGNYSQAKMIIDDIDKDLNFNFIFPEWVTGLYFSRELIEAEIRVGLINPKLINSAYADVYNGNHDRAVSRFEKLFAHIDKSDSYALEFLTNEIGYSTMNIKRCHVAAGLSALVKCITKNNYSLYEKLVKLGAPISTTSGARKVFPIMNAAQNSKKNINFLKLALAQNTDPNPISSCGWTPLLCATRYGTLEAQSLLLKAGAKHNSKTSFGRTPLHYASEERDLDFVKMLTLNGAEVNSIDSDKQTPLIKAVSNKHSSEIVPYLIKHGAQIDLIDNEGQTALFHAIKNNKTDLVKLLLKHGAQTELKNNKGLTVLQEVELLLKKPNNAQAQKIHALLVSKHL